MPGRWQSAFVCRWLDDIFVRSGFGLWSYQPYLSPVIGERAAGSMMQRSFGAPHHFGAICSNLNTGSNEKDIEETVVSTFVSSSAANLPMGPRRSIWRARSAHIDQERWPDLGDTSETMRVESLHGMAQKQAALDAAQSCFMKPCEGRHHRW